MHKGAYGQSHMTTAASMVFKPSASRTGARRIFGVIIAGGGLLLGGAVLLVGLLLLPAIFEGAKTNPAALWGLMLPVGGLLFVIVFGGVGAVLFFAGVGQEVRLTGESIALVSRTGTTTLQFAQITSVGARFVRDSPTAGHWAMVVDASSGRRIELGLAQGAYLAMFDVQPIVNALLPRLPAGVLVDERVRKYAATGLAPT